MFGRKKLAQKFEPIINSELTDEFKNKKVVLLYCTCDDFHEESLSKSMVQYWNNYETVILDDSKSNEYIEKVNEFANKHNLKVVRRENKEGFKAGNLNNFLNTQSMTLTNFFSLKKKNHKSNKISYNFLKLDKKRNFI
nr:glycosyltransferase [Mycoplasmopsis bovis]